MDRKARDRYTEGVIEQANQQIREHTARLYALETENGFDLDVATDIYGAELLDHTKRSQTLLNRWDSLFEALVAEQPGVLLLAQVNRELTPGCYGFGAEAEYEHAVQMTLVKPTAHSVVEYKKADESLGARIVLTGTETLAVSPDSHVLLQEWSTEPLLLATSYQSGDRLDLTTTAFDLGPLSGATDQLIVHGVENHHDILEIGNELDKAGAKFGYFMMRPVELLLEPTHS